VVVGFEKLAVRSSRTCLKVTLVQSYKVAQGLHVKGEVWWFDLVYEGRQVDVAEGAVINWPPQNLYMEVE